MMPNVLRKNPVELIKPFGKGLFQVRQCRNLVYGRQGLNVPSFHLLKRGQQRVARFIEPSTDQSPHSGIIHQRQVARQRQAWQLQCFQCRGNATGRTASRDHVQKPGHVNAALSWIPAHDINRAAMPPQEFYGPAKQTGSRKNNVGLVLAQPSAFPPGQDNPGKQWIRHTC